MFIKDAILMFNHFSGSGDKTNDIVMSRSNQKMVSVCCINKRNEIETEIIYEDVDNKKVYTHKILVC